MYLLCNEGGKDGIYVRSYRKQQKLCERKASQFLRIFQ